MAKVKDNDRVCFCGCTRKTHKRQRFNMHTGPCEVCGDGICGEFAEETARKKRPAPKCSNCDDLGLTLRRGVMVPCEECDAVNK